MTVDAPIEAHADAIIRDIYHIPYPTVKTTDGIARSYHGGQHVSRVALYISLLRLAKVISTTPS